MTKTAVRLLALLLCLIAGHAQAATLFWNGTCTGGGGASCTNGTFQWDSGSGTAGAAHKCWSTTSAAGGTCNAIPGASDTATFDANSGSATIVVNAPNSANTASPGNITCGAYTGTLDFATNNNNVSMAGGTGFNCSGTGTRTINMGNGNWTLSAGGTTFTIATATNLTLNANSSTVIFSPSNSSSSLNLAPGFSVNNVSVTGTGTNFSIGGGGTIAGTLAMGSGNILFPGSGTTWTINGLTNTGPSAISLSFTATSATLTTPNALTGDKYTISGVTLSGAGSWTFTNSFRNNGATGGTIYGPAVQIMGGN